MGVHQNKNFCTAKEKVIKIKRQPTQRKKILVNHVSDKRLISKIYEKLIYFKSKTTNKKPHPTHLKSVQRN